MQATATPPERTPEPLTTPSSQVQQPEQPTGGASRPATPTSRVSADVVKITDIVTRAGVADVTVRVSGPPSPGTRYLLVVRHNGGYQYKGGVGPELGDHVVEADLRRATPGSWREFFVVGADAQAVAAWEATVPTSSIEMPQGTRLLTGPAAHQLPG